MPEPNTKESTEVIELAEKSLAKPENSTEKKKEVKKENNDWDDEWYPDSRI